MPDHPLETTLDEAAREINELQRVAGLTYVITLGEILVRHFFDGDLSLVHSHGPKPQSLNQLARRHDISYTVVQLSRAVGIFEVARRHDGFSTSKNLSKSHVAEVLPLHVPDQDRLLALAEAEDWTVNRLREEVRRLRGKVPQNRPAPHPLVQATRRVDALMKALDEIGDLPELSNLDTRTLHDTEERLAAAQARLTEMLDEVREALTVPVVPDPPDTPRPPAKGDLDVPTPFRPTGPIRPLRPPTPNTDKK